MTIPLTGPGGPPADVSILPLTAEHWSRVEEIHAAGIATGHATFESRPPTWAEFDAGKLVDHRLVVVEPSGRVLAWAALSAVSTRPVYAGVVEHSLYVDPAAQGRGLGRLLLQQLITTTERAGIWTLQAGIFPENGASLTLHRTTGFSVVGTRRRLGRMTYGPYAGRWRDVVMVERRSPTVGLSQP